MSEIVRFFQFSDSNDMKLFFIILTLLIQLIHTHANADEKWQRSDYIKKQIKPLDNKVIGLKDLKLGMTHDEFNNFSNNNYYIQELKTRTMQDNSENTNSNDGKIYSPFVKIVNLFYLDPIDPENGKRNYYELTFLKNKLIKIEIFSVNTNKVNEILISKYGNDYSHLEQYNLYTCNNKNAVKKGRAVWGWQDKNGNAVTTIGRFGGCNSDAEFYENALFSKEYSKFVFGNMREVINLRSIEEEYKNSHKQKEILKNSQKSLF